MPIVLAPTAPLTPATATPAPRTPGNALPNAGLVGPPPETTAPPIGTTGVVAAPPGRAAVGMTTGAIPVGPGMGAVIGPGKGAGIGPGAHVVMGPGVGGITDVGVPTGVATGTGTPADPVGEPEPVGATPAVRPPRTPPFDAVAWSVRVAAGSTMTASLLAYANLVKSATAWTPAWSIASTLATKAARSRSA